MSSLNADELKAWMVEHREQHGPFAAHDECPYVNPVNGRFMKCVRPDIGHRCGDGFISQDAYALAKAHAPFFAVYSTWARLVIPDQQLSLFDEPRIEYDNSAGSFSSSSRKRQWWAEIYFCKHGRDFAISLNKQLNARRVLVEVVRRKPGTKKKVIVKPYLFCDR